MRTRWQLGAGAHTRVVRGDEHLPGTERRDGHRADLHLPRRHEPQAASDGHGGQYAGQDFRGYSRTLAGTGDDMSSMEAVRLTIPTRFGVFQAHAFEQPSGFVYVALTVGDISDGSNVMVRVHSECLTGDALGSLRCDCGVQLGQSLRLLTAAGRGVIDTAVLVGG